MKSATSTTGCYDVRQRLSVRWTAYERFASADQLFGLDRMLCAGITVSRHCGQEALVDRHKLESREFASGEHESGEVDGVQGTQHSAVGDVTCHLTDAPTDLPQFAPRPDRGDVSLGVGEPVLSSDTERAQPNEHPARLHQGQPRGHEDARRPNSPLDLRRGSAFERCSEHRRRVEIQQCAWNRVSSDRREPRRAIGPLCPRAARAP